MKSIFPRKKTRVPSELIPVCNSLWFVQRFAEIPDEQWGTELYTDDQSRCCALGHLNPNSPEAFALRRLFNRYFGPGQLVKINDGRHPDFPEHSPKARIIAALNRIPS